MKQDPHEMQLFFNKLDMVTLGQLYSKIDRINDTDNLIANQILTAMDRKNDLNRLSWSDSDKLIKKTQIYLNEELSKRR